MPNPGSVHQPSTRLLTRLGYALNTDLSVGLLVLRALRHCETVLEVGVGRPQYSWIRKLPSSTLARSVGIDVYRPYLDDSALIGYWGNYVRANALHLPFRDRAFEAGVALDVIEHLRKRDGLTLVKELKRVCTKRIVIMTPNGFLRQDGDENPAQLHLSGWGTREFEEMGFDVTGVRGLKPLRRGHADPIVRPLPLGLLACAATEPVGFFLPRLSFQLLAVWNNSEPSALTP